MAVLGIKARLAILGKKSKDVVEIINDRGIKCSPSDFSVAINSVIPYPKEEKIRAIAEEVITGWEEEQNAKRKA